MIACLLVELLSGTGSIESAGEDVERGRLIQSCLEYKLVQPFWEHSKEFAGEKNFENRNSKVRWRKRNLWESMKEKSQDNAKFQTVKRRKNKRDQESREELITKEAAPISSLGCVGCGSWWQSLSHNGGPAGLPVLDSEETHCGLKS